MSDLISHLSGADSQQVFPPVNVRVQQVSYTDVLNNVAHLSDGSSAQYLGFAPAANDVVLVLHSGTKAFLIGPIGGLTASGYRYTPGRQHDWHRVTSGSVVPTNTTWAGLFSTSGSVVASDLGVDARPNDNIVAGFSAFVGGEGPGIFFDFRMETSGNYFTSAGNNADVGFATVGGGLSYSVSSQARAQVVPADLHLGQVRVRLHNRCSANTGKTVYANTSVAAVVMWAVNYGQW